MQMEISQLRPEGVPAAVEFARAVGCKLDPKTVNPQVSLIAKHDNRLTAVVMGVYSPGGACELHVCMGEVNDAPKLTGELRDKALMKVHGAGVRRCQISYHGCDNLPADWSGPMWPSEPKANAENSATPQSTAPEAAPDNVTGAESAGASEAEAA